MGVWNYFEMVFVFMLIELSLDYGDIRSLNMDDSWFKFF